MTRAWMPARAGRHRDGRSRPDPSARLGRSGPMAVAALVVAVVAGVVLAWPALADAPPGEAPDLSSPTETNAAAEAAHAEPLVPGTPCGVSTRACVDLETQQAWLIHDGVVARGPMGIASGGAGMPTPVGHSLRVYRKEIDHRSGEFFTPDGRGSPMPFSAFYDDGGIAFHGGDPERSSAGCIRMEMPDAEATFQDLQMGDKVQVVNGSVERAARDR